MYRSQSRKACIYAMTLLLSAPLAATAFGGPEGFGGPPPVPGKSGGFVGGGLPPYLQSLDLDQAQRKQIESILNAQGQALREKGAAATRAHHELRRLALSSEYSEEKAQSLAEAAAKAGIEASLLLARLDNAIFQVLTPPQQQATQAAAQSAPPRHGH